MLTHDTDLQVHEISSVDDLLVLLDPILTPQGRGLTASVFCEAGRTHEEALAARIRFKTELGGLRAEAGKDATHGKEAMALLAPAEALLDDAPFWEHQQGGVACLAQGGVTQVIKCSARFSPRSRLGGDYLLLPLLRAASSAHRFYLLGLAEHAVFLYRVSDLGAEEIAGLPGTFQEALREEGFEDGRLEEKNFSNKNSRATEHSRQALRAIDAKVRRLTDDETPILVAAVDFMADDYREVCGHPRLLEQRFSGDPERMGRHELLDAARELVRPSFLERVRKRVGEEVGALQRDPETALTEVALIVAAATNANIEVLTVAADVSRPDRFDGASLAGGGKLPMHLRTDTTDFAVRQTLATGGEVVFAESRDLPDGLPMIARTRWKPAEPTS